MCTGVPIEANSVCVSYSEHCCRVWRASVCGGRAQGGVWDRAELAERQGQVRQQDRFGEKQQRGRSGKGREGKGRRR